MARVYQKSRRTTNPSEAVVRWATKTLPTDITFVSFFITFAVVVTATMFFVFNISTIAGLEIRGILVANATMFSHLLPGFSCGSKHLLLPQTFATATNICYCHKFMVLFIYCSFV